MKRMVISIVVIFALFITSGAVVEAHSGRTDGNGGHHCWTNCSKYGYEYGEYHYHNGGSSSTGSSSSSYDYSYEYVYTPTYTNADVYINDIWQYYDPSAFIKNGTTLVPMRAIFEELGATLEYNNKAKTVTAYKNNKKIVITVGNKKAYVNNNGITSSIKLTNPAEIYEGTTMVPLRFISESLEASIEWDSVNLSVNITTKN